MGRYIDNLKYDNLDTYWDIFKLDIKICQRHELGKG